MELSSIIIIIKSVKIKIHSNLLILKHKKVDFFGILSCIHCIIFKKFINVHPSKEKNSITSSIPRNYDKLFSNIFREFLNIPDSNSIPDIRNDWIPTLVNLFKMELGTSFAKYSKYLKELNQAVLRPKKNK